MLRDHSSHLTLCKAIDRFRLIATWVHSNLASNPGPYHFGSAWENCRPSWQCKVDGSVQSQCFFFFFFFFLRYFTLTLARVPCYVTSCAYITRLQLVGLWASTKPSCLEEKFVTDKVTSSWTPLAIKQYVLVWSTEDTLFWCHFCFNELTKSQKKKADRRRPCTGMIGNSESVDLRRVYGKPACTAPFVIWVL